MQDGHCEDFTFFFFCAHLLVLLLLKGTIPLGVNCSLLALSLRSEIFFFFLWRKSKEFASTMTRRARLCDTGVYFLERCFVAPNSVQTLASTISRRTGKSANSAFM